ncbi:aldolase/citrate lyase family protein [Pelomonas sp. CA6]|uniref:HpcH/HpaI aldolase/citrate lyase family protein n=1 Tax=Pelomonas sp. CA6 TaxID=2907999 RepID=UPI001F4C1743|nr:aldolase/citrate lyase family protein [Pelomonas sp. CA6]MCH7345894.1 aldolase/citrate lyase family protein [Pelomonas sp. CA6]
MTTPLHPKLALFEDGEAAAPLPVVDHYCGVEARMRKSLELQAEMGPLFDITLDCEDGAPVGGEAEHMLLVLSLLNSELNRHGRVGVRVHPVGHPSFEADVDALLAQGGERVAYLMLPKPESLADVERATAFIDRSLRQHGVKKPLPIHALIETHGGLRDVQAIAAHPRIESLSFGLMDFVSAHRGAIPRSALTAEGQFHHPLVVRAKLEIAAAAHTHGKTPSHCVVTEFKSQRAIQAAAERAAREFGYTRMWSIHPQQIQPIIDAFAPSVAEIDEAIDIIQAAQAAHWAPIQFRDVLHDRASYRYFWQVLERAHRTGQELPEEVTLAYFGAD